MMFSEPLFTMSKKNIRLQMSISARAAIRKQEYRDTIDPRYDRKQVYIMFMRKTV